MGQKHLKALWLARFGKWWKCIRFSCETPPQLTGLNIRRGNEAVMRVLKRACDDSPLNLGKALSFMLQAFAYRRRNIA
jgi:hypothetical protein